MIFVNGKQFHLKTRNTSYLFGIYQDRYLTHLYWGDGLSSQVDLQYLTDGRVANRPSAQHLYVSDRTVDDLSLEYSTFGTGDFRTPVFHGKYDDGSRVSALEFDSYRIYEGKQPLSGLPAVYCEAGDAVQTLELVLKDSLTGLSAVLSYSVFEEYDVICRSIRYENHGSGSVDILAALSAQVDFYGDDYSVLNLNGAWTRECQMEWIPVGHHGVSFGSSLGFSGHEHNPFLALAEPNTDENTGKVYGFSLCYSGNFIARAEGTITGKTRVMIGINPFDFHWELKPGETFQTPEAVMVYSSSGLGEMSRIYHHIYRTRLCRGKYRDAVRPMVINTWEGMGKDINEDSVVELARAGAELGLEMVVLDDGWFQYRNDFKSGLGDWIPDQKKLPSGLRTLAERINDLGMQFGLWLEPEMVSPNSDLYRAHPDWCIHCEGRARSLMRNQYVLDLSREEVRTYVLQAVRRVLHSANISYIKWDCNRLFTEVADQSQPHRYMLGLYEILETLNQEFPDVLIEGCCSGGGRFDPGMLYYMPQTWTSDDTNPLRRICIQYGTSIVYPANTISAHIAAHDIGYEKENIRMDLSAMVAMSANMGYEMNLHRLSPTEREQAKRYVQFYKRIRETVQFGTQYRIENPFEKDFMSVEYVNEASGEVVLFAYQTRRQTNGKERYIKLKGLDRDGIYEIDGRMYQGEALMQAGMMVKLSDRDADGNCFVFRRIQGSENLVT